MKTPFVAKLSLVVGLMVSATAGADCLVNATAIANSIAAGCGPYVRVSVIRPVEWLGAEGYYATLNAKCVGGLVGYKIKMFPRSCMLESATADLGE